MIRSSGLPADSQVQYCTILDLQSSSLVTSCTGISKSSCSRAKNRYFESVIFWGARAGKCTVDPSIQSVSYIEVYLDPHKATAEAPGDHLAGSATSPALEPK